MIRFMLSQNSGKLIKQYSLIVLLLWTVFVIGLWQLAVIGEHPYALFIVWFVGLVSHVIGRRLLLHYDSLYSEVLEEVTEQKERLKMVIDGANIGTWDWDIEHSKVVFNERWADIIGYRLDELPKTTLAWRNKLHPDEKKWIRKELFAHLAGKTPVYVCEHRLQHKSGKWVWVLEAGRVHERDKDGKPLKASGIIIDLSQQKETEIILRGAKDEAESANKMKSVFLANMSHELRTPLNGIMGYTQIFRDDELLNSSQQEGVRVIHESAQHLLELITDILDLSKIEAGRLELVEGEFYLSELLQQVADIVSIKSVDKGFSFSYEASDDLPQVVIGDELRLRQVLLNLLSNSVKFTESGTVILRTQANQSKSQKEKEIVTVSMFVEDTGPGISEEDRERIFEPFQQTGDRLLYSEGTGLGLSISRKLVQMMGGSLDLLTPLPEERQVAGGGPGSRFGVHIEFRCVDAAGRDQTLEKHIEGYTVDGKVCTAKKVLLVDDDMINRLVCREILTRVGFQIREVEDGSEALDACLAFRPDAVLMDLKMANMSGYMATRQLREHTGFDQLVIIAVSALADIDGGIGKACKEAGLTDYIAKPVFSAELLSKLAFWLNLELVYREEKSGVETIEDGVEIIPDALELQAILDYVLIGDLDMIVQEIEKLQQKNSQYVSFLKDLRSLSDNFQFDALEAKLKELL